jgi:Undecaprenyl-phosphate galactose phosphotransferase WbaP
MGDDSTVIAAQREGLVGGSTTAEETVLYERGRERWGRERAWRRALVILALVGSDFLFASLAWGIALVLASSVWQSWLLPQVSVYYMAAGTVLWIGIRLLSGLYPGYGLTAPDELRRQSYGTLSTLAIITLFAFALQSGEQISRLLITISFLEGLLIAPMIRHLVKWVLMRAKLWGKPVMVFGAGETGRHLVQILKEEWGLGLRPVSSFDVHLHGSREKILERAPHAESTAKMVDRMGGIVFAEGSKESSVVTRLERAKEQGLDTVIFAMPHVRRENLLTYVHVSRRCFEHVIIIPNLEGITTSAVTTRNLAETFGLEIKHNLLDPWALRMKRLLDLMATVVLGGVFVVPLLLVISLAVWAESRGAVFYKAKRMGQDERLFSCVKFRTMVLDAEAKLEQVLNENPELREEYLTYHKLRYDPRVTKVGRFLRKTSLDELPQLWNVLRGEMSLVGPRPYLPRESEDIGDAQEDILRVPPGVTGPWQVTGRSHVSFKERVRMDTNYVRNWSVWLDLVLLARTVESLLFRRQAY